MPETELISLVIPIYNEAKNLSHLYDRLKKVLESFQSWDYEIFFVDDGSRDESLSILKGMAKDNTRVKILSFSRNFGKEIATTAGLHYTKGKCIIIMDADLEHPPELIPRLMEKWKEGYEIVYTIREYSKETPITKKITSQLYYYILNTISSIKLEPNATDFRLLDRKVVDVYNQFTERSRFFRGLIDWMGYQKIGIPFVATYNSIRAPSYSWKKLWKLAISGLTSFSLFPLRIAGYLGMLISLGGGGFLMVMFLVRWFIDAKYFSSISFVIMFNILLSGITLTCLGFIALYIGNIHNEILNRPLYVIREKENVHE